MNLFFIERYINKLTKQDITNYALSQGISLPPKETDILYTSIKSNYKTFLTNPNQQSQILKEIKTQLTPTTASKLDELYNFYKTKF